MNKWLFIFFDRFHENPNFCALDTNLIFITKAVKIKTSLIWALKTKASKCIAVSIILPKKLDFYQNLQKICAFSCPKGQPLNCDKKYFN